jgi:hypothetical protein
VPTHFRKKEIKGEKELNQEYLTLLPSPPMPYPECFDFCSVPILHSTNILDCVINRAQVV